MKKIFITFLVLLQLSAILNAQDLKWDATRFISKDSSILFRPVVLTQAHAKYVQLNPGTLNSIDEATADVFDVALRRTCFGADFVSPKFKSSFLLGTSLVSSKTGYSIFLYDAWGGFMLGKNHILGMGQSLFSGLSRASSIASTQTLASDVIAYAFPEVGRTSSIGRQLGVFLSGNFDKFGYRLTMVRPFLFTPLTYNTNSQDFPNANIGYEGYLTYSFCDTEDNTSPAKTFSYNGAKKIINLGVGFLQHPKSAMAIENGIRSYYNKTMFAADLYIDIPVRNGAFTSYIVYYKSDFGKNNIRTTGTIDYLQGGSGAEKAGNSEFFAGTGQIIYGHVAYLIKGNSPLKNFQFYGTTTYKSFEVLAGTSLQFSVGVNYYLFGHKLKAGFEVQNRPVYNTDFTYNELRYTYISFIHFSL